MQIDSYFSYATILIIKIFSDYFAAFTSNNGMDRETRIKSVYYSITETIPTVSKRRIWEFS